MKLKDLKVGTKQHLGLGAIMLLVVVLSILARLQTNTLWLNTKDIYDHPLQVRRALDMLTLDLFAMHQDMNEVVRVESDQERISLLQSIDIHEVGAARQFEILHGRYLGPQSDIDEAEQAFIQWKSVREETRRLLREGKAAEAAKRTRSTGAESIQLEKIMNEIGHVSVFAKKRGDAFYAAAEATNNDIKSHWAIFVFIILLLSLIVVWFLLKGIKDPLAALTTAAEAFRQGKLESRCVYAAADEFGALSTLFNTMAATIQTEMNVNKNAIHLSDAMLREDEAHAFCRELLKGLIEHTGSQIGAVYLLNETQTLFEHFESIGLGAGGRAAFSATAREGELGAALTTRQIQHITDIPADSRFTFAAVSGVFQPRAILTIPVPSDYTVSAVISLASVRAYDTASVRLVNTIWSTLIARVNGVLAFQKVKAFAATLAEQNRELDAQRRELVMQAAEVAEQNTELEMQKRQLDEANRLKSSFLANMSHELRTPLNSVIALSGVLSRRLATTIPAEERNYLEIIERNGKGLLTLINDILDLSRIEAGREGVNVSRCAVRELVDELVDMIEPQALEQKIALLNQMPADLPLITTDPEKLKHILQNLIGNAVKFTAQGRVTVTAAVQGPEMVIAVMDTGIGIGADQIPHIFDEFRQADETTSRKYGGTGLGLAIAKKYAQLLEGSITVESTPGKGSTFTLRLPLALGVPEGVQAHQTKRFSSKRVPRLTSVPFGQGQVIQVVEDNESAIIQLTDILSSQGYRVQVAHNGQEALRQIAQTQPDAMILDLMMPEVDGFTVLKTIRAMESTSQLPVLILTAKLVTQEELKFLKGNHIHQLIQKGDINKDGLLAEVARMVAPPQAPALPQSRRRRPVGPGKPVVLIVEDNPDNLSTARALLAGDYELIEAMDGETAVKLAKMHRPDIILSDIALPVMDGIAVLAAIREDEGLCSTPVIAVTASAMKGDRETILAHGFDGYISKPIDAELMIKALREVLD
jgi:signal transduction histidine kinase/DNA-binding response OmpR family regulator/HAMP domain-containing protein